MRWSGCMRLLARVRYLDAAERLFKAFAPRLTQGAQTLPQMLVALFAARTPHRQVVFSGLL